MHELFEDQNFWPKFEPEATDNVGLISRSTELETGDTETDKHHRALINHINRIHHRLTTSPAIDFACKELKALRSYSEYHFIEEGKLLGKAMRYGHKANHDSLIDDLGVLIREIENGKYDLQNIGNYLEYWLINHIKTFDIPALMNNSQINSYCSSFCISDSEERGIEGERKDVSHPPITLKKVCCQAGIMPRMPR